MRKIFILFAVIFVSGLMPFGFSGTSALFAAAEDVEFNIRFFDRRIYYVQSDPVKVQITITNKSPNTFRFKLADERAFSLDFDIRTMTNLKLDLSDTLVRKRTLYQQIYFREIAIEPGESFSFVEDLRDFVNLKQPGSFRVRAKVYPELYRKPSVALESNYLALNLRPAAIIGPDGIPLEMDVDTGAVLVAQNLPPDEVVAYMLRARQESQWERFFLYLDIETMISRDASQKRKWIAENEAGRKNMIKEYRQNLQSSFVDGDISIIPTTFDVEQTVYNNNEGTVTVLAKFRGSDYTDVRRYKYFLERRDNIWKIVNYTVESAGTEGNPR